MTQLTQIDMPEDSAGSAMYSLIQKLYPICRSITGDGVRETLGVVGSMIDLQIHEVASGTEAFDWTVPDEWNIRGGYIANMQGERLVDFADNNLHVLNYSEPVDRVVSNAELHEHLFSMPDKVDWIPYRTSYYNRNWGFCVTHRQAQTLTDSEYRVVIDSTLEPGSLTYGEYVVPGHSSEEVLITAHVCHPSLCNDNLSGIALVAELAQRLGTMNTHFTYRFLFIPGTIGSIVWLSRNPEAVSRIRNGLVVVCVGDSGEFAYKKSRRGDTEVDRAVLQVLRSSRPDHKVIEFYPYGYDERQFCSPGFNLAVGSLSRSTHGEFPEYHTSADNLDFVAPEFLLESLEVYLRVIEVLENNRRFINLKPHCEPQLGKRGLYGALGAIDAQPIDVMTLLWILNLCDGEASLLDVAERSGISFSELVSGAEALLNSDLLDFAE